MREMLNLELSQVPVSDKERQVTGSVLVAVLGEKMGLWTSRLTIVAFGIEAAIKALPQGVQQLGEQRLKSWITGWNYELGREEGQERPTFYVDLSKNFKVPGVWFVRGDAANEHGKTHTMVGYSLFVCSRPFSCVSSSVRSLGYNIAPALNARLAANP